jgi:hypothetical protein
MMMIGFMIDDWVALSNWSRGSIEQAERAEQVYNKHTAGIYHGKVRTDLARCGLERANSYSGSKERRYQYTAEDRIETKTKMEMEIKTYNLLFLPSEIL